MNPKTFQAPGGFGFRALVVCALLTPAWALAHGRSAGGPDGGLEIDPLSHAELVPYAEHRAEILALAEGQKRTDPMLRRLLNHSKLQFTYCLWGFGPGGVRDEDSPYNECAHAYLATAKALLMHLEELPDSGSEAQALAAAIEREAREDAAAAAFCRFSGKPFNTAEIVRPRFSEIIRHPPSLAIGGCAGLMVIGAALMGRRRKRPD